MTEAGTSTPDPDWPKGFEGARIANLLHFASLSPEQRLQWLADMFELTLLARKTSILHSTDDMPRD